MNERIKIHEAYGRLSAGMAPNDLTHGGIVRRDTCAANGHAPTRDTGRVVPASPRSWSMDPTTCT